MLSWKQSHRRRSPCVLSREWFLTWLRELQRWVWYLTGRSGRVWVEVEPSDCRSTGILSVNVGGPQIEDTGHSSSSPLLDTIGAIIKDQTTTSPSRDRLVEFDRRPSAPPAPPPASPAQRSPARTR